MLGGGYDKGKVSGGINGAGDAGCWYSYFSPCEWGQRCVVGMCFSFGSGLCTYCPGPGLFWAPCRGIRPDAELFE